MIDEIVGTITASEEFIYCFETEGAKAFQIVEDSLRDALVPTATTYSYAGNGVYKSKYTVTPIRQSQDNYCGPASVLQALIGNGVESGYNSSNSSSKQDEIANDLGTDATGTYIGSISKYMREKFPAKNGYEYKAKAFTCNTYTKALDLVIASLEQNAVPIIRIPDTSVLGYYDGESQHHYVCISEVNTKTGKVTLVDPNNTKVGNSYPYFGTKVITTAEFEALVDYDGWIAVYTKAADGYYVYE